MKILYQLLIAVLVCLTIASRAIAQGLFIGSGTALSLGAATLTLPGNWTNEGTLSADSSTIVFSGSGNEQTITNASGETFYNMTVNSGAVAVLPPGQILSVNSTLTNNNGTSGLIIESDSTGTGMLKNNSAGVQATVEKYITKDKWHYIGIPVTNVDDVDDVFHNCYVAWSEEAEAEGGVDSGWHYLQAGDPLRVLHSYAVQYNPESAHNDTTIIFTGTLNTATIDTTFDNEWYGWNFVSNPYPTTLDWDASGGKTTFDINDSIFVWNPDANSYGSYAGGSSSNGQTPYIAPMQGFFIQAATATASISVNDSIKSTQDAVVGSGDYTPPLPPTSLSVENIVSYAIPTVSTQAVSNITTTTAIGNGNITDLGSPNPSAYGICWGTSANPTTSDPKTDKGIASATGAFTAPITGLSPNTSYHARAFATNEAGTSYGDDVIFTTLSTLKAPGNALNFDGTNDYVATTDIDNSLTAFTIEAWVKWTPSTTADVQFICGKGLEQMELHTGGGAGANGLRFIPTAGVFLDAFNVLPTDRWTHVAAVYEPTTTTAKLYINGEEVSLTKNGTGSIGDAIGNNTTAFNISRRSDNSYFFKGSIDEVRVWNTVRTKTEIQSDRITAISSASGLLCSYNFDEGTASGNNTAGSIILSDLAGNGNHGTLNNFALNGSTSNWVESYAMVVPAVAPETDLGSTSFTANWTAPAIGTVNNYLLEVATDAAFTTLLTGYDPKTVASPSLSTSITGLTSNTTYYYRVRADKTSVSGEGAWSGTIQVLTTEGIPTDLAVSDTTIVVGTEACFDAQNEITVAGSSTVTVANNASANFIAGTSIRFLPGFHAEAGSYVHGWITTDGSFCETVSASNTIVAASIEKSQILDELIESSEITAIEKSLKVYPNPNNGKFTLELKNVESGASVFIYNIQGEVVYQSVSDGESVLKINLQGMSKGIYFMMVTDGQKLLTKKILIN